MKLKPYKTVLLILITCIAAVININAQPKAAPVPPVAPVPATAAQPRVMVISPNDADKLEKLDIKIDLKGLDKAMAKLDKQFSSAKMRKLDKQINQSISKSMKGFDKSFSKNFEKLGPMLAANLSNINVNIDADANVADVSNTVNNNAGKSDTPLDELTKTFSKTYSVDRDDVLDIDNKYGKVTVNTWGRNEFKVDVQIKVATSRESSAQKMLDDVNVTDSKQGSTIYFKTTFGSNAGGSWSNGNTVRKIEVNYTVYMPAKNSLTVNNKYGSTELPDLAGKVNINNSYGSLTAKNLTNYGNSVNVKYGSANIEGFTGEDLVIAYGSLTLGEGTKLNADVRYGSAKIGTLKVSGNINCRYSGTLSIATLDRGLKNLSVNSSYSGVKLGVGNLGNADFDVTVHYGSFNYDRGTVNVVNKEPSDEERGFNPTKNFKGHLGKTANSDKTITIKTNYGSVNFD